MCSCTEAHRDAAACGAAQAALPRRKLWELAARHHCVLLGAAFDVRELRQLFRRAGSKDYGPATDYELHSSAVHFAQKRNAFSALAQKLLEESFRDAVLRFRDAAGAAELLERWRQYAARGEAVPAYWASLTHPACDDSIDETLSHEMHMVAHHAFAERRAATRRIRDLQARAAGLEDSLGSVRDRANALQRETARLRKEAIAAEGLRRETCRGYDAACAELERWRAGDETRSLRERLVALEAELGAARDEGRADRRALKEALRQAAALERPTATAAIPPSVPCAAPPAADEADLAQRRVLCVGGKTGLVPHYRAIVERARGEFTHHDGGVEHHLSRLPALLGAADAVICLAGDCSHGAYRLAKRYCKEKGKPCALLATSSVHALSQCIARLPADAFRM